MDMKPKNLLKRVLQFAREELERRARALDDAPYDSTPPSVEQAAAAEGYSAAFARERVASAIAQQRVAISEPGAEPAAHGLEVLRPHDGGQLTLRWSLSERDVARAGALMHGSPVLTLRLVSFTKTRDDVLREVQDRPNVEREGSVSIQPPTQRTVVALGLRAGERFVSIAHHVL